MYTVDSFVKAFRKDSVLAVGLYHKIPAGGLDYRPTAGQRSTLELLRYLSYGPYNASRRILAGDWKIGVGTNDWTKDWPPADFPRNMAWQADEVERLVRAASPITLAETHTLPWGETMSKAEALTNYPLKWLSSYKMQLFLYLKGAGVTDVGSADLWYGKAV